MTFAIQRGPFARHSVGRFAIAVMLLSAERVAAQSAAAATNAPSAAVAHAVPSLIPLPQSVAMDSGEFRLASPVTISVSPRDAKLHAVGELLAEVVRVRTGFTVRIASAPRQSMASRGSTITIDAALKDSNREAYALRVAPSGVTISGASSTGALWGVQTLRQLLPTAFDSAGGSRPVAWSVPAVTIRDAPAFAWRGSLLDVGRHFFPAPVVMRYIDLLSRHKMNVFHWHLTEDQGWRIEIKRYPKLTQIGAWRTEADGSRYGGFYTQREIRDVVAYAARRGVSVVPEIEMPGHSSAALAAYPELGCTKKPVAIPTTWGVFPDVYCADGGESIRFLEGVLTEVIALFPSPYIHIGGDEVPRDRWRVCDGCQLLMQREGLKDEDQLQSWFIARIATFLAKRHRKLIGWDEVLNGGLVEGATVQSWRDSSFTRAALLSGHDVIASPVNFAYLDRSPGSLTVDQVLRFNPVPPGVDSVAARHVLGGEGNLWTEWITSTATLDLMAYPRLLALSEALWTAGARDAAAFRARLGADGVARLRALGVAVGPLDADLVRILVPYDTAAKAPRLRARVGSPEIVVRATSDGSAPTADSPVIADSALLTGAGVWRLRAFVGRDPILSEKRIVLLSHKARGLPVQFAARPDRRYPGTGPNTLTDGIAASADHADGLWQGWWGPDLVATIDFGSVTSIDTVQAGFLQNQRAWILLPASVDVQLSDDGETWRSLGVQGHDVPAERDAALVRAFVFTAPAGTRARYVRVVAINAGPLPSWHPGAGRKPWIFADEIIVR